MSLGDSFEEKRNPMGQTEGVNVLGRMVSSSFGGGGGGLASEGKFMDSVFHEAQVSVSTKSWCHLLHLLPP